MNRSALRRVVVGLAATAVVLAGGLPVAAQLGQPEQRPTPPGQSGTAPGQSGTAPGQSGAAPGQSSTPGTDPSSSSTNTTVATPGRAPNTPNTPSTPGAPATPGQGNRPGDAAAEANNDEGVTSRYVVRFVEGASPGAEAPGLQRDGARVSRFVEWVFPGAVVELSAGALERVRRNPRVASVESDMVVTTLNTQTSPPWGLDRVDQRPLPLSGSFTSVAQGSGVRVYVVDTGVRADHVDFGGRVLSGTTTIDDGRGTTDCNGHGTHVAGTAAGATHGVAKRASIVAVRVLGCDGSGTMSGVVAGLDWILGAHPAGTPGVVNMSLGGGISSTLDAAVSRVISSGLLVAVAAGNSGADACGTSPARVSAALTVGATSSNDTRASWSNFGSCLDLFAPGVGITSAWSTSSTATYTISGTSMASPHVAGLAAVLWSQQPGASASQIQSRVIADATTGLVGSPGTGSPNVLAFLDGGSGDSPTTTTTSTTTTTTTIATSTTTTTKAPRGNSGGARRPKAKEDGGGETADPVVVPPGLATAAARIAESPAPTWVQEQVLERLVEVGERLGGSLTPSAVAVASLVADTIDAAPLPEPIRRELVARVRALGDALGNAGEVGGVAPQGTQGELREVVEQFREQRLLTATNQLSRVVERLRVRLDELTDTAAADAMRQDLADIAQGVAGVTSPDDVRSLVEQIRNLVWNLAATLRGSAGSR